MPSSASPASTLLRYVIIGCAASIAPNHLKALAQLPAQIVGMADLAAEPGAARAAEYNTPFYTDHNQMLAETTPDIAVICTPHPFHAPIALDCFRAGAHVLVEKPLAVEVAEGDMMISAAAAADRILAVNFQQRFRPAIEYAQRFIAAGELGSLTRALCFEPWFRTDTYYRSAAWRSTWRDEGGGVLVNQAIHTLDLFCYLIGEPTSVTGWVRAFGHSTQCEDTAQAMLEYANGAPGYFHANTIEAGLKGRIQLVGDHATLELVGDTLTVTRYAQPLSVFRATSPDIWATPTTTSEAIALPPGDGGGHLAVHRDLQAAIHERRAPRCDGHSALMSLELANAIIFSGVTGRATTLPLDRSAYAALLADLRSGAAILPPSTRGAHPE